MRMWAKIIMALAAMAFIFLFTSMGYYLKDGSDYIDVDFGGKNILRLDRRYLWLPMTHVGQNIWGAKSFRDDRSGFVCEASFVFRHTDFEFKDSSNDNVISSYFNSSISGYIGLPPEDINSDWVALSLARSCDSERLGLRNEPPFFFKGKLVESIINKCGYYYDEDTGLYRAKCRGDSYGLKERDLFFYDDKDLAAGFFSCGSNGNMMPMCKLVFIDDSIGLGVTASVEFDARLIGREYMKERIQGFLSSHSFRRQ